MTFLLRLLGLKKFYEDEFNIYFLFIDGDTTATITVLSKQELFSVRQLTLSPAQIKALMMYDLEGECNVEEIVETELPVVTHIPVVNSYLKNGWTLLSSHEGYMKNYTLMRLTSDTLSLLRLVAMKTEILGTNQIMVNRKIASAFVEKMFGLSFGKKSIEFDAYKKGEIVDGN